MVVDVFCSSLFRQVSDVHQADVVKVIPSKFSGSKEVVPLQMRKLVSIYAGRERERERERIINSMKQWFLFAIRHST
jgi:cation-transporting ATPase 13A1